jgi:hypothetical protein
MKKVLLLLLVMLMPVLILAQEKQTTYLSTQRMTPEGVLTETKPYFLLIRVKPIKNQALQITLIAELKGKLTSFYFREVGKREINKPNEDYKYIKYSLKSEDDDERIKILISDNGAILKYSDGSAMYLYK